jgi:hypothetical protein
LFATQRIGERIPGGTVALARVCSEFHWIIDQEVEAGLGALVSMGALTVADADVYRI